MNMPTETNFKAFSQLFLIVVATITLSLGGGGCHTKDISLEDPLAKIATPIQLTDTNFQQEVIDSEMPVLVEMWAPWCRVCTEMKPDIHKLTRSLQGTVRVAELNVDDNAFVKAKYGIDSYPTLLIFDHGVEIKRLTGLKTIEELQTEIVTALEIDLDLNN